MIRFKSLTHQVLEFLSRRMEFDEKTKRYFLNLDEGFIGEVGLDEMMVRILTTGIVLKDVRLRTPLGECQIDTLYIKGKWIFVFECKNFSGEYLYRSDSLVRLPDFELDNPESQLNKQCNRLRALLKKENLHFTIVKKVVYINPKMTIYNAPEKNDFLMRSQIEQHLKQANALPNFPDYQHQHLLKVLNENKSPDIRFDDIPEYSFKDFKKGMYCATCGSLSLALERNIARCNACQSTDKIADMLVRSVYEYTVLFPVSSIKTTSNFCSTLQKVEQTLREI